MGKMKRKLCKNPTKIERSKFINHLLIAIIDADAKSLSQGLNYLKIGEYCEDCDMHYEICTCEGSREKRGQSCGDCGHNRCLCDYDICKKNLINTVIEIAKKTLNNKELQNLQHKLFLSLIEFRKPFTFKNRISKEELMEYENRIGYALFLLEN